MYDPDGRSYDMMNGAGGGWMIAFAVVVILLLGLGVAALITLTTQLLRATPAPRVTAGTPAANQEARLLLDTRLARGELSPEEYRTVRLLLDGGTPA